MDSFFEWTESKHFNELQYSQVVTSEQCIEYIHEARLDVLFLQLYWMAIGLVILSVLSLLCLFYRVDSLEKKIETYEDVSHVKLV
jgi:hypothetical protein